MQRLWLLALLVGMGCSSSGDGGDGSGADAVGDDDDDDGIGSETTPTVSIPCDAPDDNLPVSYDASLVVREESFEGFPVAIVEPQGTPVGVVWYFHGASGDAAQVLGTETTATLNLLAREGVMLVGTESTDRDLGQWVTTGDATSNPDIARLLRLREHLIDTTALTASTPIITMGFSNGGTMSAKMGAVFADEGLNVAATSIHNSGGAGTRPGAFGHPLVVMVTENDSATTSASGRDFATSQADLGLPVLLLEGVEMPLEPERFRREGGGYSDPEVSRAVFDELVSMGMVDDDGVRLVPIDRALAALDVYERNATVGNGPAKVVSQLRVVWQLHRFNSQYNAEECAFLADALEAAWAR